MALCISTGTMLAILELLLWLPLAYPQRFSFLPEILLSVPRAVYLRVDMRIAQYEPELARYDSELLYLYRPGEHVFSNREFSTDFHVNSLGVRDDEDSLDAPEIIVIGDSFALGWGVEHSQSFATQLERILHKKVLSAAVSSYGTAREMRLLQRADTSNLKTLIVEYNPNDYSENLSFYESGEQLFFAPRDKYERAKARQQEALRYYFGKYLLKTFKDTFLAGNRSGRPVTAEDHARMFVHSLRNASSVELNGLQVVVFELRAYGKNSPHFVNAVEQLKQRPDWPRELRNLVTLDLSQVIRPGEDTFVLDTHLTPGAHRKLAELLATTLGESGASGPGRIARPRGR